MLFARFVSFALVICSVEPTINQHKLILKEVTPEIPLQNPNLASLFSLVL